jgi:hypothetical protein
MRWSFAACCIGLAFTCRRSLINRIYFFDLFGAGLGAMLIIGALFLLIPQNALIMLAIFALVASALMGIGVTVRKPLIATQVVCLLVFLLGLPQDWLGLRISEYKSLSQTMQVIDTRALATSSRSRVLMAISRRSLTWAMSRRRCRMPCSIRQRC